MEFGKKHNNVVFGGYAIGFERSDYRVSIDSIICNDPAKATKEFIFDFFEFAKSADDLRIERAEISAWWD
jgi:hypothetical protein